MIDKVLKYFKSSPKVIKRTDVVDLVHIMCEQIVESVNPMVNEALMLDDKMYNTKIMGVAVRSLRARKNTEVIKMASNLLNSIVTNKETILKLVMELPETIVSENTTYKEGATLTHLSNLHSFVVYLPDFLLVAMENGDKETYGKKKLEVIYDGVDTFASILKTYENLTSILKKTEKLDNTIVINEDNKSSAIIQSGANSNFVEIPINFLIDTIYGFRLFLADIEIKKYESLHTKKALIEIRITELKRQADKETDPATSNNLRKAIDVYVKEIESVEYKIRKMENF